MILLSSQLSTSTQKKYRWETNQTGAVGRMIADDGVESLIKMVETELLHLPFAKNIIFHHQESLCQRE